MYNIDYDRLSHAYITSGSLAEKIAMAAVCSGHGEKPCMSCSHCDKTARGIHPDVIYVDRLPDKRDIAVDQIRGLKKDVIVVPCEAEKKVYVINDADLMNRNAQNAFLQILEEPPAHAVFILRTENPAELLETVHSRCVLTRSQPAADDAQPAQNDPRPADTEDMAGGFFAALEQGNVALVAFMFKLEKLDRESFSGFLTAARRQIASRLRKTDKDDITSRTLLAGAERVLIRAGEMHDLNVNAGHISGYICASLITVDS